MQLAANLGAGNADFNQPRFRLYRDNLDSIRSWTTLRMGMRPGICVPETMRFDGTGWYTGTDEGNPSCLEGGEPSWNKRNLTTGAEVGLNIWRQYQATDDRAFLEHNYPLMADAARFLLAYAKEGADGKLHTSPSNAHETQWDATDPITDIAAMKSLFPVVIEAAQLLGTDAALVTQLQAALPKLLDFPRTTRNGQTVFGFSSTPNLAYNNVENLDLEPLFPYNLISDQTPADFELSKVTYANRRYVNANDWTYDPVHAARLGNGVEVAQRLRASRQLLPAVLERPVQPRRAATQTNVYDEQVGIVALALNESLAQDFDGLLRIAPAVPPGWTAEGTVSLQHRSQGPRPGPGRRDHHRRARQRPGRARHPRQEPVAGGARSSSGDDGTTVVVADHQRRDRSRSPRPPTARYLIQRPTAPTNALPKTALSGAAEHERPPPRAVQRQDRHRPARLRAADAVPDPRRSRRCSRGTPTTGDTITRLLELRAVTASSAAARPPTSPPARPAPAPTSPARASCARPPRRSASCARRPGRPTSRSTPAPATGASGTGRPPSGGDDVGFLIDLTPTGQVRIITSGRGVTTNAVPPTGRFINLVITAGRDGNLDVYVDGARIGGGTLPDLGINGCAPAELRFGADQGGGQRISAELDRTAMFTKVLSATDRARWQ